MLTCGDLIKQSFYRMGIRDNQSELEAEDINRGLEILNLLMWRLEADGLQITWVEATNPTDPLYILDKHKRGMIYILGVDICAEYQISVTPMNAALATDAYDSMLRDAYADAPVRNNVNQLPIANGYWNNFDIGVE